MMNCDFHKIGKDKYQCSREGCRRVVKTSSPRHRIFARCHGVGQPVEQRCKYLGGVVDEVGYVVTRCGKGSIKVALFKCEKFGLCALRNEPEDHVSCAHGTEWEGDDDGHKN